MVEADGGGESVTSPWRAIVHKSQWVTLWVFPVIHTHYRQQSSHCFR